MAKALLFENSEKIVSSERVLLINITEIIHCFLKSSPRRCDKKNSLAHNHSGFVFDKKGDIGKEMRHDRMAMKINPLYDQSIHSLYFPCILYLFLYNCIPQII